MIEPLQRHGFKESVYERPNQNWRCGREAEDRPCALGPSRRGRCAGSTCMPVQRGDGWRCGRPDRLGGACPSGPSQGGSCSLPLTPPCLPVKSHRAKRGMWVRAVVALTLGIVVVLAADPATRRAAIIPGPLSQNHSPLTTTCEACHTGADQGVAGWFQASLSADRAELDSDRCNECHQLGTALLPHTLAEAELAELTVKASQRESSQPDLLLELASGMRTLQGAKQEIACATCHREHQGRQADLTLMEDRNCQICHTNRFVSLADGHPEFSGFGDESAARLKFTHWRHLSADGHVAKKEQPIPACVDCHVSDTGGRHNLVRSFEVTCGSCHDDQLSGRTLTVFQLPGAPVEALGTAGEWPAIIHDTAELQDSYIDPTEKALSGFTEFLLAGDPRFQGSVGLKTLREIADGALEGEAPDPAAVAAAKAEIWAVKSLLGELADSSPEGGALFSGRLERLAGDSLDPRIGGDLLRVLPRRGFQSARDLWFPHAASEEPGAESKVLFEGKHWDGEDEGTGEWLAETQAKIQESLLPGWKAGETFDIAYTTSGHADPFLRAWLELATELPPGSEALRLHLLPEQGLCTTCHRVEETAGGVKVHWRVANAVDREQGHTRFSHSPHDRFEGIEGCQSCHELAKRELPEDAHNPPGVLASEATDSDFALVDYASRERCASCHVPDRAGDSCLACHNYHIGTIQLPRQADPKTWGLRED